MLTQDVPERVGQMPPVPNRMKDGRKPGAVDLTGHGQGDLDPPRQLPGRSTVTQNKQMQVSIRRPKRQQTALHGRKYDSRKPPSSGNGASNDRRLPEPTHDMMSNKHPETLVSETSSRKSQPSSNHAVPHSRPQEGTRPGISRGDIAPIREAIGPPGSSTRYPAQLWQLRLPKTT